jgi:hypothetical protein
MRLRLLLLGTVLAAGCAKDVTKELEEFADRACACKDKACGKAVVDDLLKLADDNKNVKGDEAKSAAAARKMGECLTKIDPALMLNFQKLKSK